MTKKKPLYDKHVPCYKSHPPLEIVPGKFILGGSCRFPPDDADILIGFSGIMKETSKAHPWNAEAANFYIPDRGVPSSVLEFKKLLDWTEAHVLNGKKVHAGCVGGHGRTGLFLSALRFRMANDLDAISYVRKNYCEHAVESTSQVEWLNKHFGIIMVDPSSKTKRKSKAKSNKHLDLSGLTKHPLNPNLKVFLGEGLTKGAPDELE